MRSLWRGIRSPTQPPPWTLANPSISGSLVRTLVVIATVTRETSHLVLWAQEGVGVLGDTDGSLNTQGDDGK